MTEYYLESGYTSLNKKNEELCGDKVESIYQDGKMTFVLADGMGSGVKANILATLTSKILCTMVSNEIDMTDCIETILGSLPVCKERGVAYSTFTVVHVDTFGKGCLIEFDNPQAILMRDGKCLDLPRTESKILGKTVYNTELNLRENDVIVMFSDGVIHAGIGMNLNFGWDREEVKEHLECIISPTMSARCVACELATACNQLYHNLPGDDTTVAALKLRKNMRADLMVGPPVNKESDSVCVANFLSHDGKKIVCGGTSSQIVARYLGTEVSASLDFPDPRVPPIGFINGIDLVTEGVLTLRRLLELSEAYLSPKDLTPKYFTAKDGASELAQILLEDATIIDFYIGQGVNEAHNGLPIDITMKLKLVESIAHNLKKLGKHVTLHYV